MSDALTSCLGLQGVLEREPWLLPLSWRLPPTSNFASKDHQLGSVARQNNSRQLRSLRHLASARTTTSLSPAPRLAIPSQWGKHNRRVDWQPFLQPRGCTCCCALNTESTSSQNSCLRTRCRMVAKNCQEDGHVPMCREVGAMGNTNPKRAGIRSGIRSQPEHWKAQLHMSCPLLGHSANEFTPDHVQRPSATNPVLELPIHPSRWVPCFRSSMFRASGRMPTANSTSTSKPSKLASCAAHATICK